MDNELRESIQHTADYVKQHGVKLEESLLKESGNKFSFLNPNDENYKYYISLRDSRQIRNEQSIPEKPSPYLFSNYNDNDLIMRIDLQIIKKTAAFVVSATYEANDKEEKSLDPIINSIIEKFPNDETFNFLKKDNKLNGLFLEFVKQMKLVAQSKKVDIVAQNNLLERIFKRVKYQEYLDQTTNDENILMKSLKIRFAAIKWLDAINKDSTVIKLDQWYDIQESKDDGIINFKEPLNFKDLFQQSVSKEITRKALNSYFSTVSKEEEPIESTKISIKKQKKRIVKEEGETRLKRRKR
ncbi:SF3a splicing factor complex subunit [Maudiozyma exigua]|uniref:SF3a splicing factor complex subunit n=1 Tax=Maudiozyma exigua TaxID=34358 RepID=A0A9P7BBP0_MAUEX|nr:SF3a splicing factor complex subunit [Kazachstania exigua]